MALFNSRRNFVSTSLLTFAAAALKAWPQDVSSTAAMRAAAAKAVVTPQPLRGGVSFLRGPFGNILVLSQPQAALIVESGLTEARPQIEAAIALLTPVFPVTLVNTHWHLDHTDGNQWMHARGAAITAHRNTLKRLSTPQTTAAMNQTVPAAPPGALPTDVFDTSSRKQVGPVNVALRYFSPAHTDSDISVHFEEPDIIHIGDIWYNGIYPLIDYSSGGHIDGMIEAARYTLKTVSPTTIIVPGHGPVGNREQLQGWLDMLTAVRETVSTAKRQGKTLAEVIAGRPTAAFDGRFIVRAIPLDVFIACVYATV